MLLYSITSLFDDFSWFNRLVVLPLQKRQLNIAYWSAEHHHLILFKYWSNIRVVIIRTTVAWLCLAYFTLLGFWSDVTFFDCQRRYSYDTASIPGLSNALCGIKAALNSAVSDDELLEGGTKNFCAIRLNLAFSKMPHCTFKCKNILIKSSKEKTRKQSSETYVETFLSQPTSPKNALYI